MQSGDLCVLLKMSLYLIPCHRMPENQESSKSGSSGTRSRTLENKFISDSLACI